MSVEIRRLGPDDVEIVLAAADLFDEPPRRDATERFLSEPTSHLFFAFDRHRAPVGFVTGVELTHPDKGTEMFLYELGVAEAVRRQGVGAALTRALDDLARTRGLYGMFVLTDHDNEAALRTYRSTGTRSESTQVMLDWVY
jgi:ribosomal protein S18 acetylase RimI-like enzyme